MKAMIAVRVPEREPHPGSNSLGVTDGTVARKPPRQRKTGRAPIHASAKICRPLACASLTEAAHICLRIQRHTGDTRRSYLAYQCRRCKFWHIRRRRPFDVSDPDDLRRLELLEAGWRQINNPDVELWTRPERSKTSPSNRKPLDQAWLAQQRRAAS